MLLSNTRSCKKLKNQRGISIIEYIIALLIVTIGIVSWLELTTSAVQTGTHVEKLSITKDLAREKATELAKNANTLFAQVPQTIDTLGSITPNAPIVNYSDYLDYQGNTIPNNQSSPSTTIPKFIRQWLLVRNEPNNNDFTIVVSVVYAENNRIVRIAKSVVSDTTNATSATNSADSGGVRTH